MQPNIDPVKIGQTIKALLKKHSMTQDQLANHLHITKSAVSQNLNGKSSFDIQNLISIAKLFNMTLDALLHLDASTHVPSQYEKMVEKGLESIQHIDPKQLNLYKPDEYGNVFIEYVIKANHTVLFNYLMSEPIQLYDPYDARAPEVILQMIIYKLESNQSDIITLLHDMVKTKGRFIIENKTLESVFFTHAKKHPMILNHFIDTYKEENEPKLFKKTPYSKYYMSIEMILTWIAKYQLDDLLIYMMHHIPLEDHIYLLTSVFTKYQAKDMLKKILDHIFITPPSGVKRLMLQLSSSMQNIIETKDDVLIILMLEKHLYESINQVVDMILKDPWLSILEWIFDHYHSSIQFYKLNLEHLLNHQNILDLSMNYMSQKDKDIILSTLTSKSIDHIDYFINHGATYQDTYQKPHTFKTIHDYIKTLKKGD